MEYLYQKYCTEHFDENGTLDKFEVNPHGDFNFGYDIVDEMAKKAPDKPAMVWCNEAGVSRTFTFSDISKLSAKTANYFKAKGIKKGDTVILMLKRHYQFWYCIVALHKIGAIVIPATHQLMTKDIVYRLDRASVKAVVCTPDDDVPSRVEEAQGLSKDQTLAHKFVVGGPREGWYDFDKEVETYSDVFERPTDDQNTKLDDTMLIYFTSGTTGMPKMVAHAFSYPLGHIITARHWHNVDPDGLHFTVADTGWGKAVWGKLYGQWMCETAVFVYDYDRFDAHAMLSVMEKNRITSFCAPPTIYRFFIHEDLNKYDLSSLKYATIAGEALNPEVYNRFREITGLKLMEGYGQTETTLTVVNLFGMEPKPGSMGKPSPGFDVDIVDEEGKTVPAGESGEIVVRTDQGVPFGLFKGYHRDEELTKKAWHDNLYHTGDVAWRDEDGYFWYVGRTDDVIKSSGYRIGPFEIESVLMEHPAVLECAVTGFPDEIRGQVIKATIVLTKEYTPSDALKKEIQNHVKHLTAPYKYPRIVEFVEELPKTISGKIRRSEIRGDEQK